MHRERLLSDHAGDALRCKLNALERPRIPSKGVVLSNLVQTHNRDCPEWLAEQPDNTFHAVVTDAPYGMLEYTPLTGKSKRGGRSGLTPSENEMLL